MSSIIQFKISIDGIRPLIWRRIQVTDDYRMDRFHQVIQLAMGWQNAHLHDFHFKNRNIGMLGDYYDGYPPNLEEESTVYLRDLLLAEGDKIRYTYDYGDDWIHTLEVERIQPGTLSLPVCLDGKNACPPEDCGGIGGYGHLIEILSDKDHPDHDFWKEWSDNFNPHQFDRHATNDLLTKFGRWHQKHPRARSTPWHQLN